MAESHRLVVAVSKKIRRDELKRTIAAETAHLAVCVESDEALMLEVANASCVLVDVSSRFGSTRSLLTRVRSERSATTFVLVADSEPLPPDEVIALHRLGAVGFITDKMQQSCILNTIEDAVGRHVILRQWVQRTSEAKAKLSGLSPRQRDVLELAVLGLQNKQIARRLQISMRTVEKHRARLYNSTGFTSVVDLARLHRFAISDPAHLPFCVCQESLGPEPGDSEEAGSPCFGRASAVDFDVVSR